MMNTITKYILIFLLGITSFTGCTDGFEDLNKNKHEFVDVEPEYLMTSAVKSSINLIANLNARMYWPYSHQITVSSGDFPGFGSSLSELNSMWANFYSTVYMVKDIQRTYEGVEGYENRVLIAQLWETYLFYIFSTTFGGIPYTDACRDDITSIPYDKETDIYVDLLERLKVICDNLDPEGDKLSKDIVFGDGDINRWKQFAYSLRLKIALEVQNAVPETAEQHGKEVMRQEEELVGANSENIFVKWGGSNTTEYSWYYERYVYDQTTSEGSKPYLSHLMFVYMRSYPDARMEKYADKNRGSFMVQDILYDADRTTRYQVRYEVPYNGKPKTTQLAGLDDNEGSISSNNPLKSLVDTQFSLINNSFLKPDGTHMLIWFADVCFMKAEARLLNWGGSKSVEEYYYDGIDASFAQYEVGSSAEAYKGLDGIRWNSERLDAFPDFRTLVSSNITKDPLQKILTQRWLAGFFYGGHDAWCYIRRTRVIDLPPHLNPGKLAIGGQSYIANLPERMHYPFSESTYNLAACTNAAALLGGGGDILPTYLKLAKTYDRKSSEQWRATPIYLNNKAWAGWYGDTIEDLIRAGLVENETFYIDEVIEE